MSQERYGIRRFALLNTAGYSLGLFPLEHPLSVYGANNLGKSASINALQFPILARMSDMSFGKYSLEQSRRFYFASDTSYILCELNLPHGPHVIGVVGRGPGGGFGHQFFAYQGELDLAHYQKDDTCLRQKELFTNLERNGLKAYELKPDELRRLLVGGHTSVPLDLTLIPLRSTSEQSLKTFRALFINLLHMREITAAKLKQLFLDAFEHSLRSGSVDYIAACEEAFRDVRRMEGDYNALVAAGPLVEALAGGVAQREILRGKLHRISPVLDNLLGTWQEYGMARKEELVIQAEHYRAEQDRLQNDQRGGTQELMRLSVKSPGCSVGSANWPCSSTASPWSMTSRCWSSNCWPPRTPTTNWPVPWRSRASSPPKTSTSACATSKNRSRQSSCSSTTPTTTATPACARSSRNRTSTA